MDHTHLIVCLKYKGKDYVTTKVQLLIHFGDGHFDNLYNYLGILLRNLLAN